MKHVLSCPICKQFFTSKSWFVKHVQRTHPKADWAKIFEVMTEQQQDS